MTIQTFPLSSQALPGAHTESARILEARFGDGYSQRSGDGLNSLSQALSPKFFGTPAEIKTAIDFLRARGGYEAFNFTTLGESTARKFICRKWTPSQLSPTLHELNCTFEEVFDV